MNTIIEIPFLPSVAVQQHTFSCLVSTSHAIFCKYENITSKIKLLQSLKQFFSLIDFYHIDTA